MIKSVHHVAITASDYARSRDFYQAALDMTIIAETYREARRSWKCDLRVGAVQIELFSFPDPPPRPSRPEAVGLRHLAFSVDDIDAAVLALSAKGIATEPIRLDDLTGRRFTFFADPDGLPLELYEA